jgi:lipid II isoglutaminyl synthase (glutamine-hydrolysing)
MLPVRTRVAVWVTRTTNGLSRRCSVGGGTVIGGRAGLAIDKGALGRLVVGRQVALVSGTNGKTTTTALLAAGLSVGGGRSAVTNGTGSNMPPGHLAALAEGPPDAPVVFEVDEGYLARSLETLQPAAVVLLNLSRDQLDRTNEVRMLAARWRGALASSTATVVANADDPLVVWAAAQAASVRWVGAGLRWRSDAVGCPACEGRIEFNDDGAWWCTCGFARPALEVSVALGEDGATVAQWRNGPTVTVELAIPGEFNRSNAVMAAAAAEVLGVEPGPSLAAMAQVIGVAGRFTTPVIGGVSTRLLLAKNPAGWSELLSLVCPGTSPVVVGINARVADGLDPSWLWDVPFEELAGRPVIATGDRCLDVAVRLHYAGVAHRTVSDPARAIEVAGELGAERPVDYIGNYTAFHDVLARQ